MSFAANIFKSEKGAATTEYALLVALIAVAVISAIILQRDALFRVFVAVANVLAGI